MTYFADNLASISSIQHGFFTRQDGYSKGLYASRNCGPGTDDDPDTVRRNRALCAADLGVQPEALLTVRQEHTPDVVTVTETWALAHAPVADAMVTNCPGVALGVLAADCTPVLFADPSAGVVGAAHAGWQGALLGVIEATVNAMVQLGASASSIGTAVGPCIGYGSYEVGPEFKTRFLVHDPVNDQYFKDSEKTGHAFFDLQSYVAGRADRAGVGNVVRIKADTCAEEDMFFSYRRSCLRQEPDYGRQLSGIALRA